MLPTEAKLIVEYITKVKGIDRNAIAKLLGVSRSQLDAWTSSGWSSFAVDDKLFEIADIIKTSNIEWSLLVKTKKNQAVWFRYIDRILELFSRDSLIRRFLKEAPESDLADLILLVKRLGAPLESIPPTDSSNALSTLLFNLIHSWEDLLEWYEETFHDLYQDEYPSEVFESLLVLKSLLPNLTLKFEEAEVLEAAGLKAALVRDADTEARKEILELLHNLCEHRKRLRLPFDRDYFEFCNTPPQSSWSESLSHKDSPSRT